MTFCVQSSLRFLKFIFQIRKLLEFTDLCIFSIQYQSNIPDLLWVSLWLYILIIRKTECIFQKKKIYFHFLFFYFESWGTKDVGGQREEKPRSRLNSTCISFFEPSKRLDVCWDTLDFRSNGFSQFLGNLT